MGCAPFLAAPRRRRVRLVPCRHSAKGHTMLDFVMLATGIGSLVICIVYVFVCERL